MCFNYNKEYIKGLYSSSFYNTLITLRNRFIKDRIVEHFASGKCLEVGFGDGNLIETLAKKFEVYGVDISNFAIEEVTKKHSSERFKICDISKEKMPFNDKFDVIVALNVIEHMEDPKFALENIFNALRRKGIFVVYFPTRSNLISKLQYKFLYDVEEHVYRPSVKGFRGLMREVGFRKYSELVGSLIPFKISIGSEIFLESLNLYFGIWGKR